jgi:hypothetical protein
MQLLIDLLRALRGLSRLFRFDDGYRNYFDTTIQGTWRSFFAMMLVAPAVALRLPEDLGKIYPNATQLEYFAVTVLIYVIGWFAVPIVALELGRWLKRAEAMPSYITVYNWLQLIHLPFAIAIWAAVENGAAAIGSLVALLSLAVYLTYLFYMSRSFLRLEIHAAAVFVIADVAISLGLELVQYLALANWH